MYWFTEDRVIASSPKVGTRTLTAMFGAPQTNITRIAGMVGELPATLFVRDHMERLASCYAHQKRRFDMLVNWPGLIDAILMGYQDMHFMPQAGLHTEKGIFLPTALIPFERFGDTLRDWGYEALHENKSRPVGDEDFTYRREELDAFYAADIELRRQCQQM